MNIDRTIETINALQEQPDEPRWIGAWDQADEMYVPVLGVGVDELKALVEALKQAETDAAGYRDMSREWREGA